MSTRRRPYHPDQVHPVLVEFVARCRAAGLPLFVFEGWRSGERGRSLRRRGVSELGAASAHCARLPSGAPRARAVDLVCATEVEGVGVWWGSSEGLAVTPETADTRATLAAQFFADLGELVALDDRLVWGGTWASLPDPAHVQLSASVPMTEATGDEE